MSTVSFAAGVAASRTDLDLEREHVTRLLSAKEDLDVHAVFDELGVELSQKGGRRSLVADNFAREFADFERWAGDTPEFRVLRARHDAVNLALAFRGLRGNRAFEELAPYLLPSPATSEVVFSRLLAGHAGGLPTCLREQWEEALSLPERKGISAVDIVFELGYKRTLDKLTRQASSWFSSIIKLLLDAENIRLAVRLPESEWSPHFVAGNLLLSELKKDSLPAPWKELSSVFARAREEKDFFSLEERIQMLLTRAVTNTAPTPAAKVFAHLWDRSQDLRHADRAASINVEKMDADILTVK